jgi:hypothetical protein
MRNLTAKHPMEQRSKKLLEQIQDIISLKHYSYQTEKTDIYWMYEEILSKLMSVARFN